AGLHKVLLAMQNRMLVPSLHVTKETSHFDFRNSPFYISREKQEWESTPGSLRRAAVSSFGFSGTNAHLVVEEYVPVAGQAGASCEHTSFIVPLSARTLGQLRQKARDLLEFISGCQCGDLASVAYMLQVGREAMEERLGFIVSSVEQLAQKLRDWLAGKEDIKETYQVQVKRDNETVALFSIDADLQEVLDQWVASGRLHRLLELWVKGLELNWQKLYGEAQPPRVSLPAYPFAKERYWIGAATNGDAATTQSIEAADSGNPEFTDQPIEGESLAEKTQDF